MQLYRCVNSDAPVRDFATDASRTGGPQGAEAYPPLHSSGGKDFVPDGLPGHHSPFISAFLVTLNQAADREGYITLDGIQEGLSTVNPEPRWGDIEDDNDPGADFFCLLLRLLRS